jgi:hypothetical protein
MSLSLALPGRVWLGRTTFDRMLAEGADPHDSRELARRAARLTSARHRRSLAAAIERALEEAEHPRGALSPTVPLQRREILAASASLVRLAKDLAGDDRESVSSKRSALSTQDVAWASLGDMTDERYAPRGVALVRLLLTDADSPLYASYPAGELEQAVRHANTALFLR